MTVFCVILDGKLMNVHSSRAKALQEIWDLLGIEIVPYEDYTELFSKHTWEIEPRDIL